MYRLLLLVFVSATLSPGHQAFPPPDASAAHTAEAAGNFAAAETIYSQIVSSHPDAPLYQRLGLVRHMQNKFASAAEAFAQAVKLDPKLWSSHLFLGIDLYRLNKFQPAEEHLETANHLHPGEQEIMFWLGAAKLALHDYIHGFTMLETVLKRDPTNADVLRLLAESYAVYGTSLLNQVGEKYPDTVAGLIVQGNALEFEGSYGPALQAYRAALARAPRRPGLAQIVSRLESLLESSASH